MKYIFLDIDGTLYDHGKQEIPASAVRAVKEAVRNGHRVFICTGRPCCLLKQVEGLPFEGAVSSAGAHVEAGGQLIYEEHLTREALDRIIEGCLRYRILYLLEGRQGVYLQPELWDYFENRAGKNNPGHEFFHQKPVQLLKEYRETEEVIYKLCLYADAEPAFTALGEALSGEYQLTFSKAQPGSPCCAELTLTRNNKASAVKKVMDYYHGSMEDTVAIGDSLNDLEMLQECGIGIAMGNADERLKPYADYVTADVDRDGIALAFQRFGLVE